MGSPRLSTQAAFPPVLPQVTVLMVEYQMRGLNAVRMLGCMKIPVFKGKTHSGQWERHGTELNGK